jgi:hypothetical protein
MQKTPELLTTQEYLAKPYLPRPLSPDVPVWERQPKERDAAWQVFTIYRDMPLPRRLVSVAEQVEKSYALIRRWASHWQWRVRVQAYDSHRDEETRQKRIQDAKDAINEQAQMGRNLSLRSYNALLQMFSVDENGQVISMLPGSDLIRLLTAMTDLWRKAVGVPDRIEGMFSHHVTQESSDGEFVTSLLHDAVFRSRLDALAERLEGISSGDGSEVVEGSLAAATASEPDF